MTVLSLKEALEAHERGVELENRNVLTKQSDGSLVRASKYLGKDITLNQRIKLRNEAKESDFNWLQKLNQLAKLSDTQWGKSGLVLKGLQSGVDY
ncbi:hypothetical protein [Vibrio mediterranei]|uniref:hypothetical protein n=1 Tax=Vibrio mediterranei TaxID=689 RepID=UPI0040692C97